MSSGAGSGRGVGQCGNRHRPARAGPRLLVDSSPVRRRRAPAMSGLRDEAEALAEALEFGVCDVAEVIAWSDAQLLREEPPPGALCEVSLAHDRYPQDVAG